MAHMTHITNLGMPWTIPYESSHNSPVPLSELGPAGVGGFMRVSQPLTFSYNVNIVNNVRIASISPLYLVPIHMYVPKHLRKLSSSVLIISFDLVHCKIWHFVGHNFGGLRDVISKLFTFWNHAIQNHFGLFVRLTSSWIN